MENQLTTKEKILNASIDLFSQKGYTETSIREIAHRVGIKESSIYNHYPSKIKIIEDILMEYKRYIAAKRKTINQKIESGRKVDVLYLLEIMFFSFETENQDRYLKMLRIIFQEQYRNKEAEEFMLSQMLQETENRKKEIFDDLIKRQKLKPLDSRVIARLINSIAIIYALESTHSIWADSPYDGPSMYDMGEYIANHILHTYGLTAEERSQVASETQ